MEFSNTWSEFKGQLSEEFSKTASSQNLGRVYLSDSIADKQGADNGIAVTPKGVLDSVKIGIYYGNQTGDDVFQEINNLGFKPRAVLIANQSIGFGKIGRITDTTTWVHELTGGLIIGDDPCIKGCGQIIENGFKVCNKSTDAKLNFEGNGYIYMAWR